MKNFNKTISLILIATMIMSVGCASAVNSGSKKKNKKDKKTEITYETYETEARPEPEVSGELDFDEVDDTTYDEDLMNQAYMNYCIDLFRTSIEADGSDNNIMVSPASVMIALQMAGAGAKDDTLSQITSLVNPDATPEEVQAFVIDYMEHLNNAEGVELKSANSVWMNEPIISEYINDNYIDYLDDVYKVEANMLPFDDDAIEEINDWVDDNTNGMIPEIIDELQPTNAMILINAIAFEGDWAEVYEDYQVHDDTFTAADGSVQDISMLYSTENYYFQTDWATGFAKYYEGYDYYFLAMLPTDESLSANEFMGTLTGEDYKEFIDSRTSMYDVIAHLPEFTYEYDTSLVEVLEQMGVTDAFEMKDANFDNIAQIPNYYFYVSDVLHKTFVDVNQTGTSAAAVTAVVMDAAECCEEPTPVVNVYLDRPFVYAIVDASTDTPVFIGTVNEI